MSDAAVADRGDGGARDDDEEKGFWGHLELIAAIILGVAGILTAYAAFQGALADGDSLDKYTESATLTADANGFYSDYIAQRNNDALIFGQYWTLIVQGDEDAAFELRDRLFSPELELATQAWDEIPDTPEAPPTPLDVPEYVLSSYECDPAAGEECYVTKFEDAQVALEEAQKANEDGDKFELASVFLAISLFLAGIATLFKVRRVKLAMLAASVLLIVPGLLAISDGKGWV